MRLLLLSLLAACSPYELDCTYIAADTYCDASSICCDGYSCAWYAEDGSGRSWECDGSDRDGNGYEDCVDDLIDATCEF